MFDPTPPEPALLTRRKVHLGGEWYVEEVWDATHPLCPLLVRNRHGWLWRRDPNVLMITRRIPLDPATAPHR